MRAIRNMEPAWEKINGRNFALVEYIDQKGQKSPVKSGLFYCAKLFNVFFLICVIFAIKLVKHGIQPPQ